MGEANSAVIATTAQIRMRSFLRPDMTYRRGMLWRESRNQTALATVAMLRTYMEHSARTVKPHVKNGFLH
ncbi:hypothetical protein MTBUT4_460004 [Magnetospirillum sp. UT-4]|nr:hypothetical protein MTBUT4_460004 [Magnetospirillum sp. UT-4]